MIISQVSYRTNGPLVKTWNAKLQHGRIYLEMHQESEILEKAASDRF